MSSSDVRDMLDLPKQAAPRPPPPKKRKVALPKREGMSRELIQLLGENTPPAVVQHHFKSKPDWRSTAKVAPWKWTPFTNGAREDGLVLHHWVRGSERDEDGDYAFAKYNTKVDVPEVKQEDYDKKFKDEDWSFEETKYLFDLCREYDLRWLVVHDRYWFKRVEKSLPKPIKEEQQKSKEEEPSKKDEKDKDGDVEMKESDAKNDAKSSTNDMKNSNTKEEDANSANEEEDKKDKEEGKEEKIVTSRPLEDIKERFYTVYRCMLQLRQENGGVLTPQEEDMYKQMKYVKENELRRKEHLEKLLSRSPAEIAEEEALVMESRKLEAAAERMLTERAEVLRILDAPPTSGSIAQYQSSQGLQQLTTTLLSDKTKKRKEATPTATNGNGGGAAPVLPSNTKAGSTSGVKSEKKANTPAGMAMAAVQKLMGKRMSGKEENSLGISYHDKLTTGVYLRSTKIATFKPTIQQKMTTALAELGLPARPVMPTAKVCAKFESLQNSLNVLMEAKKQADKLETEIKVLQKKGN
ncbi:SWR1-complex protein 4 [Trichomonascus vanleenenianus]|uniref:Swc4p n=1 Tax=Trichomonascus vanleenenianus TaxID=2268995 RepID=UPI003ECA83E7